MAKFGFQLRFYVAFISAVAFTTSVVFGETRLLPSPKWSASGKPFKLGKEFVILNKYASFNPVVDAFIADWQIAPSTRGQIIEILKDPKVTEEGYRIKFGPKITLSVSTKTGLAWGLQSFGQLLGTTSSMSALSDKPDVPFRCVTVDVARRYHSISTLKTLVRWCQLGKVRYMQLHLTDDQNWMLPTTIFSRVDQKNGHQLPTYTVAELTDIQRFASARGVTIVPEIDIPGHSTLLVALNPEEFQIHGSESTNCINFGSPRLRRNLKGLLGEIAKLFPDSPYIHIGGDEAWYPNAEKDPQIRASMEKLGPGSTPGQVFVDFVADMADEVIRLKKIPIVWEGFAPSDFAKKRIPKQTVVIAWEGTYYPPEKLITDGYQVVNGGWDPNYVVNHFPYESFTLVPLERLYQSSFRKFGIVDRGNGASPSVDLPKSTLLLGSMLCWWEGHEWNALNVLPHRIVALGCRLWNAGEEKDYRSFLARFEFSSANVERQAYPFDVSVSGVRGTDLSQFSGDRALVVIQPKATGLQYGWREDGKVPIFTDIKEEERFEVKKSEILTIQAFRNTIPVGETRFMPFHKVTAVDNLAYGCSVTTDSADDPQFSASLITDGISDQLSAFWLAYPNPQTLTIDLRVLALISRLEVVCFWATGAPTKYRLLLSLDGKNFKTAVDASQQKEPSTKLGYVHKIEPTAARFIRIETLGSDLFPSTMTRINEIRAFGD